MKSKKLDPKPGDIFLVKIGSHRIKTEIDKNGVQRLPCNLFYDNLIKHGLLDLNAMARAYHTGKLSFDEYLEFYLNIGYSMSGFAELSSFEHLEIKNPLWE